MIDEQVPRKLTKFYIGLALFFLSASTVLFVTDPFIMADIGLLMLSVYLMVTGLKNRISG